MAVCRPAETIDHAFAHLSQTKVLLVGSVSGEYSFLNFHDERIIRWDEGKEWRGRAG